MGVVGLSGRASADAVVDDVGGSSSSSVVTVLIDETESTEYTEAVRKRLKSIGGNGGALLVDVEAKDELAGEERVRGNPYTMSSLPYVHDHLEDRLTASSFLLSTPTRSCVNGLCMLFAPTSSFTLGILLILCGSGNGSEEVGGACRLLNVDIVDSQTRCGESAVLAITYSPNFVYDKVELLYVVECVVYSILPWQKKRCGVPVSNLQVRDRQGLRLLECIVRPRRGRGGARCIKRQGVISVPDWI